MTFSRNFEGFHANVTKQMPDVVKYPEMYDLCYRLMKLTWDAARAELERERDEAMMTGHDLAKIEYRDLVSDLEAKLAKAVEGLRFVVSAKGLTDPTEYGYEAIKQARATLAEIEGEKE
jgi:hypothetical protein